MSLALSILPSLARALAEPLETDTKAAGVEVLITTFSELWFLRWQDDGSDTVNQSSCTVADSYTRLSSCQEGCSAMGRGTHHFKAGERSLAQVPSQSELPSDWIFSLCVSLPYIRMLEDSNMQPCMCPWCHGKRNHVSRCTASMPNYKEGQNPLPSSLILI